MGTNRRYAHRVDEQMDRRVMEAAIRPSPISLSAEELDLERHPVPEGQRPVLVSAWVRYPETVIRASGVAVAWTDRAVLVRWTGADGSDREAWVWASAVQRREPPARD